MGTATEGLERAVSAYWERESLRQEHGYALFLGMAARKGWITWGQLNDREGPHTFTQAYLLDWGSEFDRRAKDENAEG